MGPLLAGLLAVRPLCIMAGCSPVQLAKRALVVLLRALVATYHLHIDVTRDSPDLEVTKAFRQVAVRVHPDKGGATDDSQRLMAARDEWARAKAVQQERQQQQRQGSTSRTSGRKSPTNANVDSIALPVLAPQEKGYRIRGTAVLLTYQGFPPAALSDWDNFCQFVRANLCPWRVKHWCATLETNEGGSSHIHLMLQFLASVDITVARFAFAGRRPNASCGDYLGGGFCRQKMQKSIDRGMFYVYADKEGTQRKADGSLCVEGNYKPVWESRCAKYVVEGRWAENLWKARKLSHDTWEKYLYLCRDGVLAKKRNLDAVRSQEEQQALTALISDTTKRLRSDKALYKPFPTVPVVQAWFALFSGDRLRYPLLLVMGPSHSGKTEWAKSLFKLPLELKVGNLGHFPDGMRAFDRRKHDGLILDDIRDLSFLKDHQHVLQGKYDGLVEFGSTPGGTCAYTKYLFKVPTVVTFNFSTQNLSMLETDDWLKNEGNRVLVEFPGVLNTATAA